MDKKYDSLPETLKHKNNVALYLELFQTEIAYRMILHDQSKMVPPEKEIFDEYTPKLKECTYGSDEYKTFLSEMGIALDHHYKNNKHHPEHYENGVKDMSIVDLLEMLCDWKAATLRHNDGDIGKSLEINKERFKLDKVSVYDILKNSITLMHELDEGMNE